MQAFRFKEQTLEPTSKLLSPVWSFYYCRLEQKGNDAVLYATHANVPENDFDSIKKGWHEYYWKPWKKYLSGNPIKSSVKM